MSTRQASISRSMWYALEWFARITTGREHGGVPAAAYRHVPAPSSFHALRRHRWLRLLPDVARPDRRSRLALVEDGKFQYHRLSDGGWIALREARAYYLHVAHRARARGGAA